MWTLTVNLPSFQLFLFVLLRVGAIVMSIPIFNSRTIPILFKFGLAVSLAWSILPQLPLPELTEPLAGLSFGLRAVGEMAIGLVLGLVVRLMFVGIQLAGQMMGYQMGMAIANVMDPASSAQVPIMAQFSNLMAMVVFVALNAHHVFIRAVTDSFELVPVFGFRFGPSIAEALMRMSANMFVTAIMVGAPVIAALLITHVALGLVARTVPQMNIFLVGMPLQILIGMTFLGLSLPYLLMHLQKTFDQSGGWVHELLRSMG